MNARVEDRPNGAVLSVRAAPGASRDRIVGVHGDALKVAVTASPEKGRANHRLLGVLADALGVASRDVRLISGSTARDKQVLICGWTAKALRDRLGRLLAPDT